MATISASIKYYKVYNNSITNHTPTETQVIKNMNVSNYNARTTTKFDIILDNNNGTTTTYLSNATYAGYSSSMFHITFNYDPTTLGPDSGFFFNPAYFRNSYDNDNIIITELTNVPLHTEAFYSLENTRFSRSCNFEEGINCYISHLDSMQTMFYNTKRFNRPLNSWNVSNVTSMFLMFSSCEDFNQPLDQWNVSNVRNMQSMFMNCKYFNQSLDSWNVSNVSNMSSMFNGCEKFNQPLNSWDIANVTNMNVMFTGCKEFNKPLDGWSQKFNIKITSMANMFNGCNSFNQSLNDWDTSNFTNMADMFKGCNNFNQPLNNWNTSKVTNMSSMFENCYVFNQPLNNWDTSNVTDMNLMFSYAYNFNSDISSWNVSNVTNMTKMFYSTFSNTNTYGYPKFNGDLSNWNTSNVNNTTYMFYNCTSFNSDLSNWDTSNVTRMTDMFYYCFNFNSDLSNWDTSNVIDMSNMFNFCKNFNSYLNNWNTSNVTNMSQMFLSAQAFNQPLNNWDTSNVTNMSKIFFSANNFNQSISNWDTSKVTSYTEIFNNAQRIYDHYIPNINSLNSGLTSNMYSTGYLKIINPNGAIDHTKFTQANIISSFPNVDIKTVTFDTQNTDYIKIIIEYYINRLTSNSSLSLTSLIPLNSGYLLSEIHRLPIGTSTFGINSSTQYHISDIDLNTCQINHLNDIPKFSNNSYFNGYFNNWDFSNFTNFNSLLNNCELFNRDLSNFKLIIPDTLFPINSNNKPTGSTIYSNIFKNTRISYYDRELLNFLVFYEVARINMAYNACPTIANDVLTTLNNAIEGSNIDITQDRHSAIFKFKTINGNPLTTDEETVIPKMITSISTPSDVIQDGSMVDLGNGNYEYHFDFYFVHAYLLNFSYVRNAASLSNIEMLELDNVPIDIFTFKNEATYNSYTKNTYFRYETNNPFINTNISNCFTSHLFDMNYMFYNGTYFNKDISNWDTSNVRNMISMFNGCTNFNSDISKWNVSKCTNFGEMFKSCTNFNSDISKWNVSNAINLSGMFDSCTNFNSDVSKWNVSNCTEFTQMFNNCTNFNSDVSKWNVSNCTNFTSMFKSCTNFNSDVSKWDVLNAINLSSMFDRCTNFNSDVSKWNVSNCTNFSGMFNNCTNFNGNTNTWLFSKDTTKTRSSMLYGCNSYSYPKERYITNYASPNNTNFGKIKTNQTLTNTSLDINYNYQNCILDNCTLTMNNPNTLNIINFDECTFINNCSFNISIEVSSIYINNITFDSLTLNNEDDYNVYKMFFEKNHGTLYIKEFIDHVNVYNKDNIKCRLIVDNYTCATLPTSTSIVDIDGDPNTPEKIFIGDKIKLDVNDKKNKKLINQINRQYINSKLGKSITPVNTITPTII